jgi:lipid II:glycine glycyltransferase (peptidoglycan interpeptide bridge formation enzyme)
MSGEGTRKTNRPETDSGSWHFMQSDVWAEFKSRFGWHPLRVSPGIAGFPSSVMTMTRFFPGGSMTYVPYGPASGDGPVPPPPAGFPSSADSLGRSVAESVRSASGRFPVCVRFDLPYAFDSLSQPGGTWKRGLDVQPSSTVVLSLEATDDELLARMHKKHRYNIRLAARHGVKVREGDLAELERWYELYRETAERDRIVIHTIDYYRELFRIAGTALGLRLYFAGHEQDTLAGIVVAHYNRGATYLYGASGNTKRNLMPNYALQWHAIRQARAAGCRWYDLYGIPSDGDDPDDPLHGLYRIKIGFGGETIKRCGTWDYPIRPVAYRLFRIGEGIREWYFHRLRRIGS